MATIAKRTTKKTLPDPAWLHSPPTPEHPERLQGDKPPADRSTVVQVLGTGAMYDRITIYRWHSHTPPALDADELVRSFVAKWWETCDTDKDLRNQQQRASIAVFAAEATRGGRKLDRRRAWRIVDRRVRVDAPAILALAGFTGHAEAFRNLPEITGPKVPPASARVLRAAFRETDRASTAVVERHRGETFPTERALIRGGGWLDHLLELAAREVFPDVDATLTETFHSKMTPIALGLQAAGYARICLEHNPRIGTAAIRRLAANLQHAAYALAREILTMGAA